MPDPAIQCQPGLAFYEAFVAGMRLKGRAVKDWAEANNVRNQNVRLAATGAWNGPRAVEVRAAMMREVGEELFRDLYGKRLALDAARRGAA